MKQERIADQDTMDANAELHRSAMYGKLASNVKMKQERIADQDTMDANAELLNVDGYDQLINSDEDLGKNKAGKDKLVDLREPMNEEQNTAANGKSWRVCGNTSLVRMIVCMVVCILAGSIEYELMTKIFGKPNVYLWRLQKNAVRMN